MPPIGYYDIYLKRLNRYGLNYQERTQKKREREFEDYMLKSVYLIEFEYVLDNLNHIDLIFSSKYHNIQLEASLFLLA